MPINRLLPFKALTALIISAVILPLVLSGCFLFTDKVGEAMVRIYADNVVGQGMIVDKAGYVVSASH
jgi:hypothetical protein